MSGETSADGSPPRGLERIRKPRSPAGPAHRLDRGERRRLGGEPAQEALDRRLAALDLDEHAALVVAHEAGELELGGEPVDEGPEADPLDGPLHAGAHAPHAACSTRSRSTWYALACAS